MITKGIESSSCLKFWLISSFFYPFLLPFRVCHGSFIQQYLPNTYCVPGTLLGSAVNSPALMELSWMMIMGFVLKMGSFSVCLSETV